MRWWKPHVHKDAQVGRTLECFPFEDGRLRVVLKAIASLKRLMLISLLPRCRGEFAVSALTRPFGHSWRGLLTAAP